MTTDLLQSWATDECVPLLLRRSAAKVARKRRKEGVSLLSPLYSCPHISLSRA